MMKNMIFVGALLGAAEGLGRQKVTTKKLTVHAGKYDLLSLPSSAVNLS